MRDLQEQLAEQAQNEGDEIEVEVVDDRPPEDRREPADLDALDDDDDFSFTDEDVQDLTDRTRKRIKKMTWRINEERRQREQAIREREEAITYAKAVQQRTQEALRQYQQALLEREGKLSSNAVQNAQADLALAQEEGDAAKIAQAQAALTRAVLQEQNIQSFGQQFQGQQNQRGQQDQQGQQGQQGQQWDPRIQQMARPQVSEATQKWIERNSSWFNKNVPMTSFAVGVHQDLIYNRRIAPDTPEYFAALDKAMRETFPDAFNDAPSGGRGSQRNTAQQETVEVDTTTEGLPARRPRASSPVAPVGRSNGASPSSRGKVKLTRSQVETAKRLGVTPQQYALELLKMERTNG